MTIVKKFSSAAAAAAAPTLTTTDITADYTLQVGDIRNEVDATSGNITITLPAITSSFKNKDYIVFKRIDTTMNTVTFVGTASNFEDENIQIGNDPQLGVLVIYASNSNIWRTRDIL